jgi:uncharacterized repeat protein (TIGR01451 family)
MKSATFAKRTKNLLANRNLKASLLNGGLLARASFFLVVLGLAIINLNSPSSASAPGNTDGQRADAATFGKTGSPISTQRFSSRSSASLNSSLLGLLPQPLEPGIATFASDCTTPQDSFSVGNTVCVKVNGVTISPSFPRRLTWAVPDSTIVKSTEISSDPQTDTFVLTATSVVNGRTIDNRGTWQLLVRNPFFYYPEASATFTVTDPQSATADLGVAVTANSNSVASGSQAVFEIQVNNYGPDSSSNVHLTDVVPANTTFVSFQQLNGPVFTCSSPIEGATGTTTCTLASLDWPDNSVATFIATYLVDAGVAAGTEITNSASVVSVATQSSPATADQNDKDDSSSATETVAAAPCVLTCPSNIDVDADAGQAGATVTYSTPTSTGDCGQPSTGEGGEIIPVISCSPQSGSFFPAGTTTVVCSGQTGGVCTFLVTVENPGALSITLIGANPFALECGDDFGDPGASAVNGMGQSVPVEVSGTLDNHTPGSYTLTYTATEGANSISTTRTVNVSDSAGPAIVIAGENPMTISCGQPFVDPGVSADDACEGSKSVTSSGTVDSNVPGTYTISYSASDSANHTSTASRTVIVEAGGGTVPPTITLNGDPQMTVECGSFTDPGATATVPCGGSVPVTSSGNVDAHTPGTYTITYTACVEDSPGHCDPARTSHVDRTVVVEDTAAPTITVNGANPLQVECHSTFSDPGATAHDACAADFAATASGTVDANTVGTYTITYNAQDPSGNAATAVTRTVNVVDTTGPTVTAPPDVTVNTGAGAGSCSAVVSNAQLGTGSANDACQGSVAVTRSGVPAGNVFPVGTTIITYSATDSHNNTGSATQRVIVVDNTPPVAVAPGPVTLFTGPGATSCGVVVANLNATLGTGSASDNCAGVTLSRSGVPAGNAFPVGQTTVSYVATDASGNTASANQVVTVVDNTPPTISCQADIIVDFNPAVNGATVTYTAPVGADNCPGSTTTRIAGLASGAVFPLGTTTNTFKVTDAAGNTAQCSFKVTVALTSIIGLDSVSITGSASVDSYDSTGGYPATKSSLANILSNGTITMGNSGKVWGNVRSTLAGVNMSGATQVTGNATAGTTVTKTGSAVVNGTTTNNAPAPAITLPVVGNCGPPYSPNSGITGTYSYNSGTGDLTLSGVNIATLANGTYCFHNVTLTNSAQLKVNGPVVIKLTGTLNTGGATSFTNLTSVPGNLRILSSNTGTNGVSFTNSTSINMVIYAPQTGVTISGAAPLFGTIAGKTITLSGSGMIHYDTRLKDIWPQIWAVLP